MNEIIIADMIFWSSVFLFEVPAGMIGDKIGRKLRLKVMMDQVIKSFT